MMIVSIKGLADGKYPIEATEESSAMEYIAPEFFGTVSVTGTLRKHGKRYLMEITAQAPAKFLCDISGEEYEETIQAHFPLEYIANTMLANLNADKTDLEPPFYIREDDTKIDITDEVRQELSISLPMRRIAPQYRDKDFEQVFPQFGENATKTDSNGEPEIDPRWAALKSITFDK